MKPILLVEDDPSSQVLVQRALGTLPCELLIADSAKTAIEVLMHTEVRLIVLDMGLPDQDGLGLCAQIQADDKTRHIPIFVLTAREDVSSKVAAFSVGVADYIVKPFNPLELRARIEAKLRQIEAIREQDEVLIRGDLRLNLSNQKCYRLENGEQRDLRLTALEFRLLYQIARHEEHILSRDQILNLVWGASSEVLDRTVDAHISVLRKKLGDVSDYIRAAHGQGYCFSVNSDKKPKNS